MVSKKGFTLIELLIVVAIIAILAAIAVPNFLEAQTRSKVSRTKSDMRTMGLALEAYRVDNSDYPQAYVQTIPKNQYYWSMGWLSSEWTDHTFDPRNSGQYLTSPVAYVTSIPVDLFTSKFLAIETQKTPSWGGIIKTASFWYGMRYNKAPLGIQLSRQRILDDVGYYMDSVGPDLNLIYGVTNYNTGINNPKIQVVYQVDAYDPTNGTVSNGEIVYVGKGHGFYGQK